MTDKGETLSTGTIANPRLWRIGMMLDTEEGTLSVAASSTVGEDALPCRCIKLADSMDTLHALEDAVYDNPMLLADFDRTTVLLRTPRFALIPRELAEDLDAAAEAASLMWTAADNRQHLITSPVAGTEASVLTACDQGVAAFLGRTFADARITHALVPELSYFASKSPRSGNSPKLFAVAADTCVDIMAFDGRRLLGATSYRCDDPDDMAYYAAAQAQVCGIASGELQIYVAGKPASRDALITSLRRFASHVMPWIFPSGLLADGAAMDTPFPLVILPLCE